MTSLPDSGDKAHRSGVLYAIAAYASWGFFPAYWHLLHQLSAERILVHRIVWSALFYLGVYFARSASPRASVERLAEALRKRWLSIFFSASLISVNWFTYIYAVNSGHVLESSLGYFINPLVNVLLGTVFLSERLRPLQWVATGFAFLGVIVLSVTVGHLPTLALILATSFGLYGLMRKRMAFDPLLVSTLESAVLTPLALFAWFNIEVRTGETVPNALMIWLVLGGAVTALPLLWFAEAAKRLPLSTMGFLQYLSPTFQFLLGIFFFHEHFGRDQALSFGLIWFGLAVFSFDLLRARRGLSLEGR